MGFFSEKEGHAVVLQAPLVHNITPLKGYTVHSSPSFWFIANTHKLKLETLTEMIFLALSNNSGDTFMNFLVINLII